MTVTAIAGPRLDLDGPRPVAPKHSLLNTPGVLIPQDDPRWADGRWMNGVNLIGYPDSVPLTWNACDPNATGSGIKEEGEAGPQAQFDPFVVYLPVTCSALSYPFIEEWSEVVLQATYSFAIEQALVGLVDAGLAPNPQLGNSNVFKPVGNTAKSPIVALSYLENEIGKTGRTGMLHAAPAIISQLNTDTFLDPDNLITTNGNPVVSGGGYIDAYADGEQGGAGQDWMFASGPVEVRVSDMVITNLKESLDRSDNVITFRAERWVLATFDTALQAAVLVDWDQ